MFAGAARAAVFSNPDVIRRINNDFIPVSLKAGLVNNPGGDEEGQLYREIERSKIAPQGICVINPACKVLDWVAMFDNDKSVLTFLDHALERFKEYPDAKKSVAAERYMKFQSVKLDNVKDNGEIPKIAQRHKDGESCCAKSRYRRGTIAARVYGRALDENGKPIADTIHQENYVEDRFVVSVGIQQELAKVLNEGNRVRLTSGLGQLFVTHAFLGELDVRPSSNLKKCEFWAEKVQSGKNSGLWRVEGESETSTDMTTMTEASSGDMHGVKLKWDGFIEIDGNLITRLLLYARGDEKLKYKTEIDKSGNEVSYLSAGRRIDMNCRVCYGIIGEPISSGETSERDEEVSQLPFPETLQRKMHRLQAKAQEWQMEGNDLSPILKIAKQKIEPSMKELNFSRAEAAMDEALAILDGKKVQKPEHEGSIQTPSQESSLKSIQEKMQMLVGQVQGLVMAGNSQKAETLLDKALELFEQKK